MLSKLLVAAVVATATLAVVEGISGPPAHASSSALLTDGADIYATPGSSSALLPVLGDCYGCERGSGSNPCSTTWHITTSSDNAWEDGAGSAGQHDEDCMVNLCDRWHDPCSDGGGATEEDLQLAADAVSDLDLAKLEALVRNHPAYSLNSGQSAVQAIDCDGLIIAHFPVTSEATVALRAALDDN